MSDSPLHHYKSVLELLEAERTELRAACRCRVAAAFALCAERVQAEARWPYHGLDAKDALNFAADRLAELTDEDLDRYIERESEWPADERALGEAAHCASCLKPCAPEDLVETGLCAACTAQANDLMMQVWEYTQREETP